MIYPCPKPPKGRPGRPAKESRLRKSDGKRVEICRGAAWEERREEVGTRAGFRCEKIVGRSRCNRYAPLHAEEIDNGPDVMPSKIYAGHAHHTEDRATGEPLERGMGGANRDDSAELLMWVCDRCHDKLHGGKR